MKNKYTDEEYVEICRRRRAAVAELRAQGVKGDSILDKFPPDAFLIASALRPEPKPTK